MSHSSVDLILATRLVAIIRLDDLSHALALSRALLDGGIVAQEFTLTNPNALEAIERIIAGHAEFQNGTATIGVGSVRSPEQVIASVRAGAQFVVSPNTDAEVMKACQMAKVPCMPGAMTPTEIANAWRMGAAAVKVFPVRGLGPSYISDVLAPMPELRLMPTGGVDSKNMAAYLNAGAVAVGIGVNALNKEAIAACRWDEVTQIASQCAKVARGE